jgi:hypothetical protein
MIKLIGMEKGSCGERGCITDGVGSFFRWGGGWIVVVGYVR